MIDPISTPARVITALAEVSAQYDAIYCDLWGCLHNGKTAFPSAVAALQAFRAQGGTVLLLTNSPRPKPSVVAQLERVGVPRDAWDEIASSGDAAQHALLTGSVGRRVYHIGAQKDLSFFDAFAEDLQHLAQNEAPIQRVALAEAEGIVCTGLRDDLTETPEDYRSELLFAKTTGLPMLCANPDIFVDFGETRLFCAGALAQAYTEMGGRALYFGKPHPPIYDLARRRLTELTGKPDARVLCIGDGIHTDILGASGEGLDSLFVTGGLAASHFGTDPRQPDGGLLTQWLHAQRLNPTYSIGMLA